MQAFEYHQASHSQEAFQLFQDQTRSAYLAGGTSIVDLMKLHVMMPNQLIELSKLPYNQIQDAEDSVTVGALVSNNEMAQSPLITQHFPVVKEALLAGASYQLRNLATTAGNILQRTRCAYYRDEDMPCNKRDPGTGCAALEGYNRMNALLGTSDHCNATNPSDLNVALMALNAVVLTEGPQGKREIAFDDFFLLPGSSPHLETKLARGELITGIRIPKKTWYSHSAYIKVRDRSSYAFALTSVALAVQKKEGKLLEINLALGGVGTVPWRAKKAEAILKSKTLSQALVKEAISAEFETARAYEHNAFKTELTRLTLQRGLEQLEGKFT